MVEGKDRLKDKEEPAEWELSTYGNEMGGEATNKLRLEHKGLQTPCTQFGCYFEGNGDREPLNAAGEGCGLFRSHAGQ